MYRDHWKGPGGPLGGATYPGGPYGLKWEGNQPLVGWGAPLGPPAPRVGNPRGGGRPTWLGGQATPLGRRPPWRSHLPGPAPPQGGLYKGGEGGQQPTALGASLLPCNTSLSLSQKLGEALPRPATSTTTPSCCWISINLSFPLAGSRRRRRLPSHTCVERGGDVRSTLGPR